MKVIISKRLAYLEETAQALASRAEVGWAVSLDPDELAKAAEGAAVLVATKGAMVDAALLERLPELRLVAVPTAGYDWVDVAACSAAGVPVLANTGVAPEPVADYTLALLLLLTRRIAFASSALHASGEFASVRERFATAQRDAGEELQGLAIGVVGLGAIGRCLVERLRAIGCSRLYGYDPYLPESHEVWGAVIRSASVARLAAEVRVLTVHVPLLEGTAGLISADILDALGPASFVVNTSRGGVVDEAALAEGLRSGRIAGAALDVFADEPLPASSPLLELETLVTTPHIAGVTKESDGRRARNTAAQILRVLDDERPEGLLNPEVWASRRRID